MADIDMTDWPVKFRAVHTALVDADAPRTVNELALALAQSRGEVNKALKALAAASAAHQIPAEAPPDGRKPPARWAITPNTAAPDSAAAPDSIAPGPDTTDGPADPAPSIGAVDPDAHPGPEPADPGSTPAIPGPDEDAPPAAAAAQAPPDSGETASDQDDPAGADPAGSPTDAPDPDSAPDSGDDGDAAVPPDIAVGETPAIPQAPPAAPASAGAAPVCMAAACPVPDCPMRAGTPPRATRERKRSGSSTRPPAAAKTNTNTNGDRRLKPGELTQMVKKQLSGAAGDLLSAGEIARELKRSSGAVANALTILVNAGEAVKVDGPPARFRLSS